ncbi:hypothetical protein IMSAGC009_04630 [Lachnospiraceae bacterium]|nr:hypothetical protein IMSAGC009_04630 [Lachnospiraceae bacterium]
MYEPTRSEWEKSPEPAYGEGGSNSTDLKCVFSKRVCGDGVGRSEILKDGRLFDFWGEGYIQTNSGFVTGFRNAYNINHQYQLVSNGPNKYRKIPNRIPVEHYEGYNLKRYISNGAAHYVTLMGAPLTVETGKEIARILNKEDGVFLYFSSDEKEELLSLKNKINPGFKEEGFCFLDKELYRRVDAEIEPELEYRYISIPIGFVYMAADRLLKLVITHYANLMGEEIANILYGFYERKMTSQWKRLIDYLRGREKDGAILEPLDILCKNADRYLCIVPFLNYLKEKANIFYYMKKVYGLNEYAYLSRFFEQWKPDMTKVLFYSRYGTIRNLEFDRYLKLPKKRVDRDDDKPVYGGSAKRGVETGEEGRFQWRMVPVSITKTETIVSIWNAAFNMPLKLPKGMIDRDGDRPAYGGSTKRGIESDSKQRFYWKIENVNRYGTDFYTLTNVAYDMPLKLPVAMVDKEDDQPAYGGSPKRKIERNQERRFYWCIQAVEECSCTVKKQTTENKR